MKRVAPYVVSLFFVGRFVFACSGDVKERDDENFREDVVKCEEAIARISSCCPGVTHDSDACHYHHYYFHQECGCEESGGKTDSEDYRPVLGLDESNAVLDAHACSAIACGDMQTALRRKHERESHDDTPCHDSADSYY